MVKSSRPLIILGAGPQVTDIVGTAQAAGFRVVAIYDDDPTIWGTSVLGAPVVGAFGRVEVPSQFQAIVAISDSAARRAIVMKHPTLSWATVIHPRAYFHPEASLQPGTVVFAGSVVQPSVVIGAHVVLNANVTIAHDCILDDFVTVDAGVALAGNVHVETGALLEISSAAIPNLRIGAWSHVRAGSIVIRDVPPRTTVAGTPARPAQRSNNVKFGGVMNRIIGRRTLE